jgi:hypothetical protein
MLGNRGAIRPTGGTRTTGTDDGYMEMLGAEETFYNDLDRDAASKAAAALGPHSLISVTQPLTRAAWHTIPSTYVIGSARRTPPSRPS